MRFKFIPTFITFFNTFRHFPAGLPYLFLRFADTRPLGLFFPLFQKKGFMLKTRRICLKTVHHSWTYFKTPLSKYLADWRPLDSLTPLTRIDNFVYSFFFYKLNKLVYKYSNYKRSRYSIVFQYIPPFKRFKFIFFLLKRSLGYYRGGSWKDRFSDLNRDVLYNIKNLRILKFIESLQTLLFLTHRRLLLK